MTNRLYLVRHGENKANLTLELSYRKVDYSLTPKGVLQAQQTAEFLQDKDIHEIYSSPLKRAVETAEIIARPLGLPVKVVEAFREINVGDLEGQPPTTAVWARHNAILEAWNDGRPDECFPGGEDYHSLLGRTQSGLVEILSGKSGRNIVIAGHGGMFTFTMRDLCSEFDLRLLDQGLANCSVTELEARVVDGRIEARLVTYGFCDHLNGEAAMLVRGYPVKEDLERGLPGDTGS